jgi:hypothetical protein
VCVLALLCGRSSVIYKELFAVLTRHARRLKLKFRPAKITSDFELALIKTVAEEVSSLLFYFRLIFYMIFSFPTRIISDVIFILRMRFFEKFSIFI